MTSNQLLLPVNPLFIAAALPLLLFGGLAIAALGAPVLAVPGNHDIPLFDLWARLHRPYGRYSAAFGTNLEPVQRSPDLMVVGVNTTRPALSTSQSSL